MVDVPKTTAMHMLALSPAGRDLIVALARLVEQTDLPPVAHDAARLLRRAFRDSHGRLMAAALELDRLQLAIAAFNPRGKQVRTHGDDR